MRSYLLNLVLWIMVSYALSNEQKQASTWLSWYNSTAEKQMYNEVLAQWNYYTNSTDYNANMSAQADAVLSAWQQEASINASHFNASLTNTTTQRLLRMIKTVGIKLNTNDTFQLSSYVNKMISVYSTNTICAWINGKKNCSVQWSLDPDLMHVMATSRDYDQLSYVWNAWRDANKVNKATYQKFVPLSNKGAKAGGFNDTGAWWRSWYESPTFKQDVQNLYYQILPLYEKLHAYVRVQLIIKYAEKFNGYTIPAHILGNMWGQEWQNIADIAFPFPNAQAVDVTGELLSQNYTAKKMFQLADDFFGSLGLIKMPPAFWSGSIITKPNRPFVCHASAWDFYNRKDFRIKMCTSVNMNDLITIHHEMGHIEYYLNYAHQPVTFRNGANPGFHEAIGDTIALSVSTPAHLKTVGLLKNYNPNKLVDMKYLFKQALEKVAFLPFGYMIDHWRWNVFDGTLTSDKWNQAWWGMRYKYQGLTPPTERSSDAFDPASKSHIDDNTPYIRYFVSFIVQFQFYQSLCNASGYVVTKNNPLYKCDFFNNTAAGDKLSKMLQMGSSQPWPAAMTALTGQDKMNASAFRAYFKPLEDWIDQLMTYVSGSDQCYGWGYQWPAWVLSTLPKPRCPDIITPAKQFLSDYNDAAAQAYYNDTFASWNYNTNLTDANSQIASNADAQLAQFENSWAANASKLYNIAIDVLDRNSLRQLSKIKQINIKLTSNQTKDLSNTINYMSNVYSNAKICSLNPVTKLQNCSVLWDLPNDITKILATSSNYDLLSYVWGAWRDVAGKPIKGNYSHMVNVSNIGAKAGGHSDTGDAWRSVYEDQTFQTDVQNLWNQVLPLYEQLHTYVRKQLRMKYPGKWSSNAIPAHILGNMWAQSWQNIFNFTAPFQNVPSIDVTQNMIAQKYTPETMFHTADNFFASLGMKRMPQIFWNNSMIVQPTDGRKVVCHASAWDFYNAKDVRIKMCTHVDMSDLVTVHHEMGHIEYYLQYAKQPVVFRGGANPGFHEAIGDTMALSVNTPAHMKKINLLPNYTPPNPKQDMNYLYRQALSKIAFLPFGYIVDQWRWNVFSGTSTNSNWNNDWWKLRWQYQGVESPLPRGPNDFDPGAKFHIPSNVPYIRYFISYIIQFQFYKAMCTASGYKGPLYQCDFYNSTKAGDQLAQMMQLGTSVKWPIALKTATGNSTMSASALMEYFSPLMTWLQQQNQRECFGWGASWPGNPTLPEPRCSKMQETVTCTSKVPANFSVSGSSLAFVVDMYNDNNDDMLNTIRKLKEYTTSMFDDDVTAHQTRYNNYILVQVFVDGSKSTNFANSTDFVKAVEAINLSETYSGPTCGSPLLSGINATLQLALRYSQLYVFTASTAKDSCVLDSVLRGLVETQSQVTWVITGTARPCRTDFTDAYASNMMDVVAASAGSIIVTNPDDIYHVLVWIAQQHSSQIVVENYKHCKASDSVESNVDVDYYAGIMSITVMGREPGIPTYTGLSGSTPTYQPSLMTQANYGLYGCYTKLSPAKVRIMSSIFTGGMCGMQVRMDGLQIYVGYTNDSNSDVVSHIPPSPPADTIAIVHVTRPNTSGASNLTLDYAQLLVWVKNAGNMSLWQFHSNILMHHRTRCSYEYYSDPFPCPGRIFVVNLFGRDEKGYQWSRRIPGQCREVKPAIPTSSNSTEQTFSSASSVEQRSSTNRVTNLISSTEGSVTVNTSNTANYQPTNSTSSIHELEDGPSPSTWWIYVIVSVVVIAVSLSVIGCFWKKRVNNNVNSNYNTNRNEQVTNISVILPTNAASQNSVTADNWPIKHTSSSTAIADISGHPIMDEYTYEHISDESTYEAISDESTYEAIRDGSTYEAIRDGSNYDHTMDEYRYEGPVDLPPSPPISDNESDVYEIVLDPEIEEPFKEGSLVLNHPPDPEK